MLARQVILLAPGYWTALSSCPGIHTIHQEESQLQHQLAGFE